MTDQLEGAIDMGPIDLVGDGAIDPLPPDRVHRRLTRQPRRRPETRAAERPAVAAASRTSIEGVSHTLALGSPIDRSVARVLC